MYIFFRNGQVVLENEPFEVSYISSKFDFVRQAYLLGCKDQKTPDIKRPVDEIALKNVVFKKITRNIAQSTYLAE